MINHVFLYKYRFQLLICFLLFILSYDLFSQEFDFDFEPPPVSTQQESSNDDVDLEFLDLAVSYRPNKSTKLLALAAHSSDFDTDLLVMDATYQLNKELFSVGTAYIYLNSETGTEQHTARVHLDLNYKTGDVNWVIRNSWDHRIKAGGSETRNRLRSRARFEISDDVHGQKVFLYGYVEPIYSLTDDKFTNIYSSVGTYFSVTDNIYLNALYFRADNREGIDANLTSLGILFIF